MFPKMRNFLQVVLTASVVLASTAQAQTTTITTTPAAAIKLVSAEPRVSSVAVTDSQNSKSTDLRSASAPVAGTEVQASQFSVVPQVGIGSLLAALAGLMLMRIWLSNKRKLSTIR